MKTIGGLIAGILIGLTLMGIFGLSFLAGPSVDPLSAYCRGFTEGWSYAFQVNASQAALTQVETDANEVSCMSDRLYAEEAWLWRGPLLPNP